MKSFQVAVYDVDDIYSAVNELNNQIDLSQLKKNTCGIVYCDYDIDVEILYKELNKYFKFPFIGCTTIGQMDNTGYHENSISVTILTDDEVEFSIGISEEINVQDDFHNLQDTYKKCSSKLHEKEKLIFVLVPWWRTIMYDDVVKYLDEASGNVPVFGGIASDFWGFTSVRIFDNNGAYLNQGALLLISGEIKPIFSIETSTTAATNIKHIITKAEKNVVYEINEHPAIDFITELGLYTDKDNVIMDYMGTPFLSTKKVGDNEEIQILRAMTMLDHDTGSCRFIGKMDEEAVIEMTMISKDVIEKTLQETFDKLFEKINASYDYEYSTILLSSCAARYCLIVADKNVETRAYTDRLNNKLNVTGLYSYGEFCPAKGSKTENLYNILSNESFTIVAI